MESVSGYLSLVKTVNSLPVNKIHLPAAIRRISYSKSVKKNKKSRFYYLSEYFGFTER